MRGLSVGGIGWRESRRVLASLALALLLGVVCLAPSSANAGEYHDFLCRIPYGPNAGKPAPTEDVTYPIVGNYVSAGNSCPAGGSLYAQMSGEVEHPSEDSASGIFSAPAGETISGFTVWRYEADGPSVSYGTPVSNLLYYNPGAVYVDSCSQFEGCPSHGTPENPFDESNKVSIADLSGATVIQWRAACGGGGTCPASGTTYSSQYEVYAADIDLVDDTPPAVSNVSGPLVAGGTLSGEESVSFNASDGQSGVYGGSLIVDGKALVSQVLDTNEGHCQSLGVTNDGQRSFEYAQPCLPSLSAGLTLNTSQLTPGAHSLELIVEDAAGNQTIAYNGTITVGGPPANPSPPTSTPIGSTSPVSPTDPIASVGPGSPAALRGPANGTNASEEAKLTARWSSTAKAVRTSRYGQADRISGRLTTSAGQPISGALLDVYETPASHGAVADRIGGVTSGPAGQWTLTLPRGISSCALRFAYRSHLDDTVAAATAVLTLRVHAGLALRIAPHTASVGRKIFFSGVLHGTPIPEGGKQLVLEARSGGGEWIQFDTISTGAKGRYHSSYRFKFPGPVTYQFRVLSRFEADFPFLNGTSNIVAVHEY
jgi:hypothetical protein